MDRSGGQPFSCVAGTETAADPVAVHADAQTQHENLPARSAPDLPTQGFATFETEP